MRFVTRVYFEPENRIKLFASLRIEDLDDLALERRLDQIGSIQLASPTVDPGSNPT